MAQLNLFGGQEYKRLLQNMMADMDTDTALSFMASLTLDNLRQVIDRFPPQQQQEIVAQLTNGYLEKWNKEECNEK